MLEEARRRVHHLFDINDNLIVAFSGGKDSLTTLHIVREVALERGITDPIPVIFRDEEVIPDSVISFVNEYRQLDWIDMRWLCIPLHGTRLVLGTVLEYVQWDPNREWVRPMPEWGLRSADVGIPEGVVVSQFTADEVVAAPFKGKVCIVTGIRAAESLQRFRAVANKLTENYIAKSGSSDRVTMGRPIFDWQENDVFRYFYDEGIRYCPIYDSQAWTGQGLRVATMINIQQAKSLHQSKVSAPELYENVLRVFPDMAAQERYHREFDKDGIVEQYGQDFVGVRAYIERFIPTRRSSARRSRSSRT